MSRLRIDVVTTSAHFDADPETVWKTMLSYEEVPGRPSLILRILLPNPIRTQGDKTSVGARVLCTYKNGELVKRIVKVEAPNLLEFQVSDQHLGIERWITLGCGSYQIRPSGVQTKIALTTNYHGHLWPRFFWRPMERLLGHQFHHHILNGMRDALPLTGSVPCTTSP